MNPRPCLAIRRSSSACRPKRVVRLPADRARDLHGGAQPLAQRLRKGVSRGPELLLPSVVLGASANSSSSPRLHEVHRSPAEELVDACSPLGQPHRGSSAARSDVKCSVKTMRSSTSAGYGPRAARHDHRARPHSPAPRCVARRPGSWQTFESQCAASGETAALIAGRSA